MVGPDDALASVLAGVTGASEEHRRIAPVQFPAFARPEGRQTVTEHAAEQGDRVRALYGQHHRFLRYLGRVPAGDGAQAFEVLLRIGGVVDHKPAVTGQVIDEDIVLDASVLVAVERVVSLAHRQRGDIVGGHRAQERRCMRPLDPCTPEVRDIEDSHAVANGTVLRDDAPVLERHLPAGKG